MDVYDGERRHVGSLAADVVGSSGGRWGCRTWELDEKRHEKAIVHDHH